MGHLCSCLPPDFGHLHRFHGYSGWWSLLLLDGSTSRTTLPSSAYKYSTWVCSVPGLAFQAVLKLTLLSQLIKNVRHHNFWFLHSFANTCFSLLRKWWFHQIDDQRMQRSYFWPLQMWNFPFDILMALACEPGYLFLSEGSYSARSMYAGSDILFEYANPLRSADDIQDIKSIFQILQTHRRQCLIPSQIPFSTPARRAVSIWSFFTPVLLTAPALIASFIFSKFFTWHSYIASILPSFYFVYTIILVHSMQYFNHLHDLF